MDVAFDNFDELTNTLSGADSLHETMSIMYQNLPDTSEKICLPETSVPTTVSLVVSSARTGKKRTLYQQGTLLEPYRQKTEMPVFSYKHTDVFSLPDVSQNARNLDLIWMISHALNVGTVPMLVGYNAKTYEVNLSKQDVRYMRNLR